MDCNNDNEMWDWQGEQFGIQEDTSKCLWNGVNQNENLSYMFDETTPIKACGELAYNASNNETVNKGMEQYREASSQLKRRRMLQFDAEELDASLCNEDISSILLESKESENSIGDALSDMSEWVSGFAGCSGVDQSSEAWLDDCLNDAEMHFSPEDINSSGASDIQIDVSELCNTPPLEYEANMVQEQPRRIRQNVVFKGRKSYMQTTTTTTKKVASAVVYPFAFVKPCGVHGDVTLKDINQRIRTPPPSRSKQSDEEDASASYPTSAFSGKPVVGKTKIRTEGGRGSITIMRTRG